MKNILFVASECVPFIKTGGLADVVGALPKMFPKEEYDVRVVIPNYTCIPWEYREKFQYVHHFYMDLGQRFENVHVGIMTYELDGITYWQSFLLLILSRMSSTVMTGKPDLYRFI